MKTSEIDNFVKKINIFKNVRYNQKDQIVDILYDNKKDEVDSLFLKGPLDLVGFLEKQNVEYSFFFKKIKLSEMSLAYFSNCLFKYIYQIIDEQRAHGDTCWGSICENTVQIGKITETNDLKSLIDNYCKKNNINSALIKINDPNLKIADGWVKFLDKDGKIRYNLFQKLKLFIKRVILQKKYDRSIELLKKIRKEGFDKKKFNSNQNNLGVVAGYSTISKDYMIFHGKHRIAVLKYLQLKGEINEEFEISIPYLRYDFNHFKQSAPGLKCDCQI